MAEKKKYTYKSRKEKEYEAAQKTKAASYSSAVPELRRHVVYKHADGTNINIYESYTDTQNNT